MTRHSNPRQAPAEVFWSDASPAEHAVQIYANSEFFLDALEGFLGSGLRLGEAVLVIATPAHRRAIERRLRRRGFDLTAAMAEGRYTALDADATLAQFVSGGRVDAARFQTLVETLMARVRQTGRPVRAFGEMVVLLWERGEREATVALEALWNDLCAREQFRLFCAYPESCFAGEAEAAAGICQHHTQVFSL
jgi:hypothetical protein